MVMHNFLQFPVIYITQLASGQCPIVEEYTAELNKYAKNYLPILFNVYTADGDESDSADHQVVLDTVRDYLSIADQQVK